VVNKCPCRHRTTEFRPNEYPCLVAMIVPAT
jgi:hypothetical protein